MGVDLREHETLPACEVKRALLEDGRILLSQAVERPGEEVQSMFHSHTRPEGDREDVLEQSLLG